MSIRIYWVQLISLLDSVGDDWLVEQGVVPPLSTEVDGGDEYQLSSAEDCRVYCN